jgi:hypothetical protein
MSSNESAPLNSVHGRDLSADAQVYVHKIVSSVASLDALCPLDSSEKTQQAIPFWTQFYDVIGFSTLDIELENAILQHHEVLKLMPALRRLMGECEVALEVTWAAKVAVARDSTEGTTAAQSAEERVFTLLLTLLSIARGIFNEGTLHGYYPFFLQSRMGVARNGTWQSTRVFSHLGIRRLARNRCLDG